jgi:hypothetical protein
VSGATFPAALDEFCTVISGIAELSGVQIVQGYPGPVMERESILVGPVVDIDDDFSSIGQRSRREHWTAHIYVTVSRPGDEISEARDRCIAMVDAIDVALRSTAARVQFTGTLLWSSFHRVRFAVFVDEQTGTGAAQMECRLEGTANY